MMKIQCESGNSSKGGEEGLSYRGMGERDQLYPAQFPACLLNPADKGRDRRTLYNRTKQQASSLSEKLVPSP